MRATRAPLPQTSGDESALGFRPRHVEAVEAFPASPWASGGGTTRVVAAAPGAAPAWRISVATVEDGAVFSQLPGISRLHLPVSAGGTILSSEGRPLAVADDGSVRFDGSLPVTAAVPSGRALALNLMTTADGPTVELRHERVTGPFTSTSPHAVCTLVRSGSVVTASGRTVVGPAIIPAGFHVDAVAAELVEILVIARLWTDPRAAA